MNWSKKIFACFTKLSLSSIFYSGPLMRRELLAYYEVCNVTVGAALCIWLWYWQPLCPVWTTECFSFISFCFFASQWRLHWVGRRPWVECIITMGTEATVNPWECSLWPPHMTIVKVLLTHFFYVLNVSELEWVCESVSMFVILIDYLICPWGQRQRKM